MAMYDANKVAETRWVQVCELDVWGNEYDGWDVNNVYKGDIFEIPTSFDEVSEEYLFNFLKGAGFIASTTSIDDVSFYFDYDFVEISDSQTEEPLYQIWAVPEDELAWNAKNGTAVYNLAGERLSSDEI